VCTALACFFGLRAVLAAEPSRGIASSELIRLSTYSPMEWRRYQQAHQDWYQRWCRPLLIAIKGRLRLSPKRLDPMLLVQAGLDPERIDTVEIRLMSWMAALVGAALGCLIAVVVSGTVTVVPLLAWLGYIAPLRVLAALRRRRQTAILAELPELIGMLRAFITAGMPLERALHVLSAADVRPSPLKQEIRAALARYGLGMSIEEALEEIGPRSGVDDLEGLTAALSQSKRTGSGLETSLREQELMIRLNRRNRATAQAAAVSTKLLGVMAGIYLPEFVILIIVPLFWGVMQRAFG
jgi:Flp pilus assembly protein TadB